MSLGDEVARAGRRRALLPKAARPVSTLRTVGKPVMVVRSIRVPLALWTAAREKADEREENISDVIRDALQRYVNRR